MMRFSRSRPAEIGMVPVVRIHLGVQGKSELEHFGAHSLEFLLGVRKNFGRSDRSLHHQLEFLIVEVLAQAPSEARLAFS